MPVFTPTSSNRPIYDNFTPPVALRKEVETLKARLAALSGDERSSPDRLRMKHRALRSRVAELEGEVERLRSLNRQLQQATYGRRSERRSPSDEA